MPVQMCAWLYWKAFGTLAFLVGYHDGLFAAINKELLLHQPLFVRGQESVCIFS
jgi:hypothetical protein